MTSGFGRLCDSIPQKCPSGNEIVFARSPGGKHGIKRRARISFVIDTTGSVVYTGKETPARLRRNTTTVHPATPPEVHDRMLADITIDGYLLNRPGFGVDDLLNAVHTG